MILVLSLAAFAFAEDPTFVGAAAPAPVAAKPETKVQASAGGNFTVGNSEAVAFTSGVNVSHKWAKNQLGVVGAAAIGFGAADANGDGFLSSSERCLGAGTAACAATAEQYSADGRYDRFLTEKSSVYVLVGGLHDKFAGFQLRSHGQIGYAVHAVEQKATHLKLEVGADFANEAYVPGVTPASARLLAAQVGVGFDHAFNESVSVTNALTLYEPVFTQPEGAPFAPHLTDVRVGNIAALNAKMTDKLSIQVSDTLAWRNEPVAPPDGVTGTRSPFDNALSVALVASLL